MYGKKTIKKITDNKIVKEIVGFGNAMGQRYTAPNAASIAFYLFISMIPLFILLCSQLPLTGISKGEMIDAVTTMIPETVKGLVSSIISEAYNSRIGVFSFSIIMLLWSSSRGVMALIRSLDIVYQEQDSRDTIDMYMFSMFCTVCLLLAVSLMLVIYTKELTAEELLRSAMPSNEFSDIIAKHIKDFDVIFASIMIFSYIYKAAPAGKRKFINQLPGGIFSAIGISLFSYFFAEYTGGSNIYKSFYGSLTTICIFLMWLYSCINIFLIGGVINSHFESRICAVSTAVISKFKRKRKIKKENKRFNKHIKNNNDDNDIQNSDTALNR